MIKYVDFIMKLFAEKLNLLWFFIHFVKNVTYKTMKLYWTPPTFFRKLNKIITEQNHQMSWIILKKKLFYKCFNIFFLTYSVIPRFNVTPFDDIAIVSLLQL